MRTLRYALADALELVLALLIYLLALPILALAWVNTLPVPNWARPLFKIVGWLFYFWVVHRSASWFYTPQHPTP
jgi:lysylphosphatidylglycerol synthetase-like protein (DUF2156 family)